MQLLQYLYNTLPVLTIYFKPMKLYNKTYLFFVAILVCCMATAQTPMKDNKRIEQLINANTEKLETTDQLLLVFNEDARNAKATLVALEKKGKNWAVKFKPVLASIGRNGFAEPGLKAEGDGKSPTGLYDLGRLFTYEKSVNTSLPFQQVTVEDKWIDDPSSADYNKYVRGETTARSFEKLLLSSIDYKYCMVIEYNTQPPIKGKGSAIFFHLADKTYTPTSGCVAVEESDMQKILKWLKPDLRKSILMGNENILVHGPVN